IVDWRRDQIERKNVRIVMNTYADRRIVLAENPDVVIIASGGMPNIGWIDGFEHCVNVWDFIATPIPRGDDVIVYDGTGRHPAPQAAEAARMAGRNVSLFSIDGSIAQELSYAERIIWKKKMYSLGVSMQFDHELVHLRQKGNRTCAVFRNMATQELVEREADHIVVEHGTEPLDELYLELRGESVNDGVTDLHRLVAVEQQLQPPTMAGFELYRVGDAVASRNIHSAILDSLRLCSAL
ncbi:MAG: N-methylproline demethylase, partial [Alphaproteobacteria bacterium]|nr:N-methylproline demethylase [Alphaproteobacteria bacterium]